MNQTSLLAHSLFAFLFREKPPMQKAVRSHTQATHLGIAEPGPFPEFSEPRPGAAFPRPSRFHRACLSVGMLGIVLAGWLVLGMAPVHAADAVPPVSKALVPGKFGTAVDLATEGRTVTIPLPGILDERPVTFLCWVKINSLAGHNILMSVAPKEGRHWEVFTSQNSGALSVYIPAIGNLSSQVLLKPGQWYYVAFRLGKKRVELFVDGKPVLSRVTNEDLSFDMEPLILGGIVNDENLHFDGVVDDLVIRRGDDALEGMVPKTPAKPETNTPAVFPFDNVGEDGGSPNTVSVASPVQARIKDDLSMPVGDRFLDEVEEDARNASTLHGDDSVEAESLLPAHMVGAESSSVTVTAAEAPSMSLDGGWLLKEGASWSQASIDNKRLDDVESEGITAGWFKENVDRSGWRKVQVPTTVQNALLKLGEIPDPFYDANTYDELQKYGLPKELPWNFRHTRIEMSDWWFARTFELPKDWEGKRIQLSFDGLDYSGSVYLNGRLLGSHAGMFGGPDFDIGKAVRYGEPNTLVVRVDRAPDTWRGILKGSPGWGWHYGHMISLGLWRGVTVAQVPDVTISAPFVRTSSLGDDKAVLLVQYDVVNRSPETRDITVNGTLAGKNFSSSPVNFANRISSPAGRTRWQTEVTLGHPKLWWPLNYGDQNLYTLKLQAGEAKSGTAVAADPVTFGVRTVGVSPLRGTKAGKDYRWQFVINGVPMFIKGANWCWSDPMLQLEPAKYEHLIELARRAGIQMFRAWGGGIIETDEFYRLCDEKGLMVYQEFPYCWGPPSFPMTDGAVLDQQVSRVVKRLRNHPSLVMWGGGNENVAVIGADEGLFLVGRRCRQFDPTRPFHRTDPWGGNNHNWDVFHGGAPIDSSMRANPSPFFGEFGLPSMPNWDSCLKILPANKLDVWPPKQDDGGVIAHMNQFGFGDLAKVMRYADYAPIKNWKDYIEYSQMAQGDEIAFATNTQRAGSYFNKGGLWFYKFTDLFPGHSWAVVGFFGEPKLSYYRAMQFYAPQAAFIHADKYDWLPDEPFSATLNVNNDTGKPLENATTRVVVYGSDLKELWSREDKVPSLGMSSRVELPPLVVNLPMEKMKPFLVAVSLRDSSGRRLSDQWMWFNFRAKTDAAREIEKVNGVGWPHERAPEAFKAYAELPEARLLNLPKTQLSASVRRDGKRGSITVRNESALPAFNVLIDGFPLGYGDYLDDNSFCLYPKEERTIGFELASPGTPLDKVSVRAWNAATVAAASQK